MKTLSCLFPLLLFIYSCSTKNPYEDLIHSYAEEDRTGVKTDIQFKAIEIKELNPITVSDSIEILKMEFDVNKVELLKRQREFLKIAEDNLTKEKNSRIKSHSIIEMINKNIQNINLQIDSINHMEFASIYDKENKSKILLIPIECTYSYTFPQGNPEQVRTDIFYFTPQKNKIIAQKQIKK